MHITKITHRQLSTQHQDHYETEQAARYETYDRSRNPNVTAAVSTRRNQFRAGGAASVHNVSLTPVTIQLSDITFVYGDTGLRFPRSRVLRHHRGARSSYTNTRSYYVHGVYK